MATYRSRNTPTDSAEETDFHRASASLLFGFDYEDPKIMELRDSAKPIAFSVIYGGGPTGIAAKLGITKTEAGKLKWRYLYSVFPKLGPYIESVEKQASMLGYVRTGLFGVKVAIPRDRPYVAINYLLQSTEAELLKKIIVQTDRFLQPFQSFLSLPFHDEIVFQIHKSEYFLIPYLQRVIEGSESRIPIVTDAAISETTWGNKERYQDWIKRQADIKNKI